MIMGAPKKHAKFAASSSDRWVNCPGSLKLSEKAPPQKSGAAADEGTKAHELMEFALQTDIKSVVKFFQNDEYPLEMRKHVQGFVDFVRNDLKPHHELLVEEKVHLDFIHPTEAFGTVDVAIIEPFGALHIIDFKYGQGFVNHRDNSQMIFYALGIAHKHQYDFEEVHTTIYQPRAGSSDPARTDSFSVEKLKSWAKTFKQAVKACETADVQKDLNAGAWCKFCPAKVICPAISKSSLQAAKLDFSSAVQPAPKSLTSDQLKTILDRSAYLELWIKEVKKYAEEQVRAGMKIQGWGLEPKRPQRVWADPDGVAEDHEFLLKEVLSTPVEAEKIMKENGWTKKEIEQFFKDNVVAVSGGDKLSSNLNDYGEASPDSLFAEL